VFLWFVRQTDTSQKSCNFQILPFSKIVSFAGVSCTLMSTACGLSYSLVATHTHAHCSRLFGTAAGAGAESGAANGSGLLKSLCCCPRRAEEGGGSAAVGSTAMPRQQVPRQHGTPETGGVRLCFAFLFGSSGRRERPYQPHPRVCSCQLFYFVLCGLLHREFARNSPAPTAPLIATHRVNIQRTSVAHSSFGSTCRQWYMQRFCVRLS
jgi:hypothetical protein